MAIISDRDALASKYCMSHRGRAGLSGPRYKAKTIYAALKRRSSTAAQ
jgi:hypothetical protein